MITRRRFRGGFAGYSRYRTGRNGVWARKRGGHDDLDRGAYLDEIIDVLFRYRPIARDPITTTNPSPRTTSAGTRGGHGDGTVVTRLETFRNIGQKYAP